MTTTTSSRRRTAAVTALAGVAAGAAVLATSGPAAGAAQADLAQVRAATARFHDVRVATAEGYVPVSGCEQLPGTGAMGIHYLNPALAGDAAVDPARPEVLLYLPGEGGLRLVGVEWFVAEAATGGVRPNVLGRGFDGPMDGHSPGMPRHYDLHSWVWAHNPTGTFSAWNPAISCGGAA